jgi:hypothetical protein
MSEREAIFRTAAITYFPMFIAVLSLVTSIYIGYLNDRMVDIIQSTLGRSEYLRTCKEIIDAYFQVKFRTRLVAENAERAPGTPSSGVPGSQIEAANAVNKFAALGTYLANLGDDAAREQYTHLSWELEKVVREAEKTPVADLNKLFGRADEMFGKMNHDCVKTAKQ